MEILITSLYFIVFCFFISRIPYFQLEGIGKKWMIAAFSLKFLCGILLWAIYSFYYTDRATADIFKYFDDANVIYHQTGNKLSLIFQILTGIVWQEKEVMEVLVNTNHWFRSFDYIQINDNRIIIRLNLLFLYFSRGIFHVHALFFTFLSFIGAVGLYRFFSFFDTRKTVLFVCAFLLPSVIFWTSGILKESWLMFLMGLLLFHFIKCLQKPAISRFIKVFVLVFGMLFIKPFVILLLIPAMIFLTLLKAFSIKREIVFFLAFHTVVLLVILAFLYIGNAHSIFGLMQAQQDAFYRIANEIGDVSTIPIPNISTFWDALFAAPTAVCNTLLRPFIWESENILQLFAAVENLLYILLIFMAVFFFKKPNEKNLPLVLFCITFVIALSLIVGWTTPILGTIVRYKVPLLPFFAILLFQFIHFDKMGNFFKK